MTDIFSCCGKCGNRMQKVSLEDSSPLIAECENCGHKEFAEIQVPPSWPVKENRTDPKKGTRTEQRLRHFDLSAIPFSGKSAEEILSLPIGWIILWILVLVFIGFFIWIIL